MDALHYVASAFHLWLNKFDLLKIQELISTHMRFSRCQFMCLKCAFTFVRYKCNVISRRV
jgi:hypothetical protein